MITVNGLDHYFGGKGSSGTYQRIINHIRPHDVLIVPFLGNCAIIRNIARADTVIGIDTSGYIIDSWYDTNLGWIQLIKGCGISYLENFVPAKGMRYVIYCDPPYPLDARKSQLSIYEHELSDADHVRILQAITRISGSFSNVDILISTYPNKDYEKYLAGWPVDQFNSTTRHGQAIELLYMNYTNDEGLLHDYSYIGKDYRERERIKKKIKRWVTRLEELPAAERNAIVTAIDNKKKPIADLNTVNGGRIRTPVENTRENQRQQSPPPRSVGKRKKKLVASNADSEGTPDKFCHEQFGGGEPCGDQCEFCENQKKAPGGEFWGEH